MWFFCFSLTAIRIEISWFVFAERVSCHYQIHILCISRKVKLHCAFLFGEMIAFVIGRSAGEINPFLPSVR